MALVKITFWTLILAVYMCNSQSGLEHTDHNHKPIFKDCSSYKPTLLEETTNADVITVHAFDDDPLDDGGTVSYSIIQKTGARTYFSIDNSTGQVRSENRFDRDEPSRQKEVYLSIQATDNGKPSLADICTFKVTIQDINDNAPIFDQSQYSAKVAKDLEVDSEVMRLFAYDFDDGENSRLTYNFVRNDSKFAQFFRLDSNTGVLYLKQSIESKEGTKFEEQVRVVDHGEQPLDAVADVSITVVGSDKKTPSITTSQSKVVLKENFAIFDSDRPIATFQAQSNINDRDVVFELLRGKTTQTNKDTHFILTQNGTSAGLSLGRGLDYETVTEYTLTVIVKNKDHLSASLSIKVEVEDVNDEIPTFIELLKGSILENDQIGAVAMQVRAVDKDGTSANNIVSYELLSHQDLFEINKETGIITAKQIFDREAVDGSVYHVQVRAYDNSPSALYSSKSEPNSAVQTFQITIEDKNDNAPYFEKKEYVVESISENADIQSIVIEVRAKDKDTAADIKYNIVDGNTDDAFLIEPSTGRIKVKNKLDFETVENYTLKVRAFDGIFDDITYVKIFILNENDEPPRFESYLKDIEIQEETTYDSCVITLKAYDPDIKDRNADQKIFYDIQKPFAHVDKNGCVTITKPLDRDKPNGSPVVQVFVSATDSFGPTPLVDYAELNFYLKDINDNAPFLNVTEVVWYENQPPGFIAELSADDYDSSANGPPFSFSLSDNAGEDIKSKFSVEGKRINALVTFDREEQKFYNVPITITDSGTSTQTGTSILKVIIGDENDNEAKSGSSTITVNKYVKLSTDIKIGRVYVEDLDDWDLPDKEFVLITDNPNFYLDYDDRGMIVMKSDIGNGTYHLKFSVTESAPLIPTHTVDADVEISVKIIPEEAVVKSGSIRLNETTVEAMIDHRDQELSKIEILQHYIAQVLNTSVDNVDVFTILQNENNDIDVRFSAHGSPYYQPEKLENIVADQHDVLENKMGIHFVMIGINECLNETVCNGSCSNILSIKDEPATVFFNKTSFIGIKAVVEPNCECVSRIPYGCLEGGLSIDGGSCVCPENAQGPNCEITAIGFAGDSWALYPTIEACNDTLITMTISPQTENGLIFYAGPLTLKQTDLSKDFLSLELYEGTLLLKLNFGYGPLEITSDQKLTINAEHTIEIKYSSSDIQLKLPECGSDCFLWKNLPINNLTRKALLNVNGPLQIGGMRNEFSDEEFKIISSQSPPTKKGFFGCVKNFKVNNYLYNLGSPADSGPVQINCMYGLTQAVTFGIDTNFLVAILVCCAILILLLLAVVVHRRKQDNFNEKEIDDTRANIINYEDEGGGEYDTSFDLSVLRPNLNEKPYSDGLAPEVPAALTAFLDEKKDVCDKDPDNLPFDNVRHYAYEGDGNSTGSSLSSLASCTDEGDLKFNYLSNFGPRFRKLADMYGNDNSDDDSQDCAEEAWC